MASGATSKIYETRRRTRSGETPRASRVDRRRTRLGFLSHLHDSGSSDASGPTAADTDSDSSATGEQGGSAAVPVPVPVPAGGEEGDEEGVVARARRKRQPSAVLEDSSSPDSEEDARPVRRVVAKKRSSFYRDESESESSGERQEGSSAPGPGASERRRERQAALRELSERRRARSSSFKHTALEDSSEEEEPALAGESDSGAEEDDDSLKDFIVADEEQPEEPDDVSPGETDREPPEKAFLSHHLSLFSSGSHYSHFQVVVKALLINSLDESFLKSLYGQFLIEACLKTRADGSRRKRYAKEMMNSLYYFDQRFVLPRLENLKQRSRWRDRYKERVECYPTVKIFLTGLRGRPCEACEMHRHSKFTVRLSGQLYDSRTLHSDSFMASDTQDLHVGSVCAQRTRVYHRLQHFKYHLSRMCCTALQEQERPADEPVKATVSRVFQQLHERGWIKEKFDMFEDYLNDADYFQEEKLD
ncbi:coiled-coil domain-containing protein 82 isoform X1 [Lepisosteus oculatus]|uniref:coiled-coil domain-containing protein 82 isoform X1 n=1 Tax=Lepisosteus oculatus TaxID=7918 RepID=UPI00371A6441